MLILDTLMITDQRGKYVYSHVHSVELVVVIPAAVLRRILKGCLGSAGKLGRYPSQKPHGGGLAQSQPSFSG